MTALRFWSGGRSSTSLAAIARGHLLSVDALACHVLADPPSFLHQTPYEGVSCEEIRPVQADRMPEVGSINDAVLAVRDAVRAAVTRALGGVRRAAVLAGGGVDSSALAASTAAWTREGADRSMFVVALDFEGAGDDRPHLAALERHLRCEVLRLSPEDAAARAGGLASGVDGAPLVWPSAAMEIAMLAKARANGAEIALMGVGGDALFDGEPRALAKRLRDGDVRGAVSAARRLRGFPRASLATWLVRPLVAPIVPGWLRARRALGSPLGAPSWAGPRLRESLRARRARDIERAFGDSQGRDHARALAQIHLASLRHQESVASGLPRRDPFLDPALVALVRSLPPAWLLHGDVRRGLFRAAMRHLLPASVIDREDKASFAPALARFAAATGGLAARRELARVARLGALGLVEPRRFASAFLDFVARPELGEHWVTVWPALAVEAFLAGDAG